MSPNDIDVILHYFCQSCEHPRADAPAVMDATKNFIDRGLLVRGQDGIPTTTEGGDLLVQALCSVPLPLKKWCMP